MSTGVEAADAALDATLELPGDKHGHVERPFGERYALALANGRLPRNLTAFQRSWRQSRESAVAETDFARLRARLKEVKSGVIEDLDGQIARFVDAATRAGAVVHHAEDAAAAAAIVLRLAEQRGVRIAAKSKSMVSEEVDLNLVLSDAGIETVETDLGEWIVQLRGERPSHMVMPAVHLGRAEVGEAFSEALGRPVPSDDIGAQVRVARDELRDVFFAAGMGITGANALIAESGTVMMVTNEGNGRLCSSLPPVHVVMAGIEKLVPTFDDAAVQLRLLARSATAQRLTSYTTFITGPTAGHEMHVVLVDNGRRRMAATPEFAEALHCIRCAACANVCPAYREVGGHVFGHVYTGAIGLVVTPFHHGLEAAAGPQSLCVSCNACETVCPVGIPLPRQILDVRKMVAAEKGLPPAKRAALAVYARPRLFDLGARIAAVAQRPLTRRSGFLRGRRVPILRHQTRWRSLPGVARRTLRDRVRAGAIDLARAPIVPNQAAGLTVALFPGCLTDRLYPEQGEAIVEVMRALGVRVVVPPRLHCCGLPANNSGDDRGARRMAKQTIAALERTEADLIVSGSASCVAMLTQDYLHLFRDDPFWLQRATRLAPRVRDFTSFVVGDAALAPGSLAGGSSRAVAYHDSCQGSNALGLRDEPRRLLREVLGDEPRELDEATLCCGFGGSFSFEYPEVARRLMERKLDDAERTGAPVLATDNQGCIMHLRGGCDASGRPLRVAHLAELVAERLRERERSVSPS
ncbi:MAG: LUD domain-containing protein [Chloroflexota bacterium]|nr:LUD domain-containing protein [Chloroflexota bacterium]